MAVLTSAHDQPYQTGVWACLGLSIGLGGLARRYRARWLTFVSGAVLGLAIFCLGKLMQTDRAEGQARRAAQQQQAR